MKKTLFYTIIAVLALAVSPAIAENMNHKCEHNCQQCDCPHKKDGKCDHKGECKDCKHCKEHMNCQNCAKCEHKDCKDCKKCEHCKAAKCNDKKCMEHTAKGMKCGK